MAVIVRIISADGKKVIQKAFPKLPANIKVPAGAHVDVIDKDTGQRMSLGEYVNTHSPKSNGDDAQAGSPKVAIQPAQDWKEAEAHLDALAESASTFYDDRQWYAGNERADDDKVLGYNRNTLLIGGLVGGGVALGALALSGGGGDPKDEIPPAPPTALDLATDDDTGTSTSDNITSKTEGLTITGNAEAGSEVEIFDGNTSLGKVTASGTGAFTLDVTLAAGVHAIRAVATDAAGNRGTSSAVLSITVDNTGPDAIQGLTLVDADDSGISATDNITNKTSALTIAGVGGTAGSSVELFDGTLSLGKATVGANGAFTLDVSLAEGVHNITAVTQDVAGNKSVASSPLTITVDTTKPLPVSLLDLAAEDDNGASNTDNITSKTSGLTITGTGEPGATVELIDTTRTLGTVVVGADGKFAFDVSLTVGSHAIIARITDIAGNVTTGTSALEITIVPPSAALQASTAEEITGFAAHDGLTHDSTVHDGTLPDLPLIDPLLLHSTGGM